MPLTKEQFAELDAQGFTPEEIASFEQKRQSQQQQAPTGMEEQNILGRLFNVPGAAIRSAIQGKGYVEGAVNPSSVPRFQDQAIDAVQKSTNPAINAAVGLPASQLGFLGDIATDPTALLALLSGKIPTGGGTTLGGKVAGTKAGQAVGRFMTKSRSLKNVFKFDNELKQAVKAKESLDTVRNTLGNAKKVAVQEVADVPAEVNWNLNKSPRVTEAVKNPVYGVEFTPDGKVKGTVGNLDKAKEAIGDLLGTEKVWQEAPKTELRLVKKFWGEINGSMKSAARGAGKPIDKVLGDYNAFMKNYRLVNKNLVDTAGQAYGNKIKNAFKFGAERAYKEAWGNVAKQSPEIKAIMKSMNNRELLKNILKVGGVVTAVGGGGKLALDKLTK